MLVTSYRRAIALIVASAALTSFSFVPYNVYALGFLGLIPALHTFRHFAASRRQTVSLWLIWTLLLNLIGYHWIMHTIAVYGMMPTFVAFPLFLLYSLGTGGKILLFFFFLRWMYRRTDLFQSAASRTLAAAAAFGVCELIGWQLFRGMAPTSFRVICFLRRVPILSVRAVCLWFGWRYRFCSMKRHWISIVTNKNRS